MPSNRDLKKKKRELLLNNTEIIRKFTVDYINLHQKKYARLNLFILFTFKANNLFLGISEFLNSKD